MSGLENRPFVGTWKEGRREVVQHTPDAIVLINGDMGVPGCLKCNGKLNLQKYITTVSVDAGTDASGGSATVSLSLPVHQQDPLARSARGALRPGLEVTIYFRGFFPVRGLYSSLAAKEGNTLLVSDAVVDVTASAPPQSAGGPITVPNGLNGVLDNLRVRGRKLSPSQRANAQFIFDRIRARGYTPAFALAAITQAGYESSLNPSLVNVGKQNTGKSLDQSIFSAIGLFQINTGGGIGNSSNPFGGLSTDPHPKQSGKYKLAGTAEQATRWPGRYWNAQDREKNIECWLNAVAGWRYRSLAKDPNVSADYLFERLYGSSLGFGARSGVNTDDYDRGLAERTQAGATMGAAWTNAAVNDALMRGETQVIAAPTPPTAVTTAEVTQQVAESQYLEGDAARSMLEEAGLEGEGLEDLLAYPYYHVFHGVLKDVGTSWVPGAYQVTLSCTTLLHFWSFHKMNVDPSVYGTSPSNTNARISFMGHNFTGMHPYEIVYTLHNDTAGSAGGVASVLSDQTNVAAESSITGESLFGLNLKYWQQRFSKTRLRMHGATGTLFSSAQAAFLSRLSGSQITGLLQSRFAGASEEQNKILGAARALGLLGAPEGSGVSALEVQSAFGLNMGELIAFVENIGNYGSVAFWETTYESKMDIVQRVCEVTGFEFYQDVDGDFVFKPPMYNLDTSASRVYRIRDIDIISISFQEQEPEYTFMTIKGSQYQNVQGTGLEGEWGVRGQYIDYRLVAEFGWRPADLDLSYLTDPKAVFFAAMNRLDLLNITNKTANLMIPLRPEIRPGYPVYIEYLDCFYYCTSISHGYQVGSDCTTTLTLAGRRSAFHPPMDPTKVQGRSFNIEAVQLTYPSFPAAPLEVYQDGQLKLTGMPNVVMALDPYQLNPLFFSSGSSLEDITRPESLEGLLKLGVDLGVLQVADRSAPGPLYVMRLSSGLETTFWFPRAGETQGRDTSALPLGSIALLYREVQSQFESQAKALADQYDKLAAEIATLEGRILAAPTGQSSAGASQVRASLAQKEAERTQVLQTIQQTRTAFESELLARQDGVGALAQLIKEIGSHLLPGTVGGRNLSSTATYLDLLGDRKAGMCNGVMPGAFRYYSASHPNKEHQGQPSIRIQKDQIRDKTTLLTPFLDSQWQGYTVPTFVPSREIPYVDETIRPGAYLEPRKPLYGIKVQTKGKPEGVFLPTSEIRDLMFSVHEISVAKGSVKKSQGSYSHIQGASLTSKIKEALVSQAKNGDLKSTPETLFEGWLSTFNGTLAEASLEAPVPFPQAALPDTLAVGGDGSWARTAAPEGYSFLDHPEGDELWGGSGNVTVAAAWTIYAQALADHLCEWFLSEHQKWAALVRAQVSFESACKAVGNLNALVSARYGAPGSIRQVKTQVVEPNRSKGTIYPPVFPVSDGRGYTVIGSQRYGRDINIDPDGVLGVLEKQDPLAVVDKDLVEDYVDALIRGQIQVTSQTTTVNGETVTRVKSASRPTVVRALEQRLLQALKSTFTDQQMLDLGLASHSGTPNVLEMDLQNWVANQTGSRGLQRLPILNAGKSLADITLRHEGSSCQCRVAEAGLLLDLATSGTLTPVSRTPEAVTAALREAAVTTGLDWATAQDRLQGR